VSTRVIWSGQSSGFRELPDADALPSTEGLDYLYFTSNETIHGVQFAQLPLPASAPRVCDMSSDFLSRPIAVSDYRLLFACAQKNAGIAGVTIVIVQRDALTGERPGVPAYLDYRSHLAASNLYNTPPTFAIYVLDLMLDWLQREFGSLAGVQRANSVKARQVYEMLDRFPEVYVTHAERSARSIANVTFNLTGATAEAQAAQLESFLRGAQEHGLTDLRGHRSVGGVRVSLYNAMPPAAVDRLVEFMEAFAKSSATLRVAGAR
jgi:phosphoserine aminotransferase